MEWVETTGRTVEEAKDAALDQLGVDESEAEFEIVEEPKSGLFGRVRQEARVRARVRPTTPRPKQDRRERRRRGSKDRSTDRSAATAAPAPTKAPRPSRDPVAEREGAPVDQDSADKRSEPVDLDRQGAEARSFLEGLLDAFDLEGEVAVGVGEDEALEARVDGDDLGLLIGPKGQTLQAVQELARAVLQRAFPDSARLRVDIGGYRERRREALERFTRQVAEQVLSSGQATSLEPMGAADRKVVHDTVNTMDGVRTTSEGEDPRRRVVISPE